MNERNALRERAIMVSRAFKDLFAGVTQRRRHWWRLVFLGDGERMRRAGEHVLADLRAFCFAHPNNRAHLFNKDPLITARRLGRREVFDRITTYLNLDEAQVQKLMEIDDGND